MNFKRKHTGTADHDMVVQLSNQIKNAEKHYVRILNDKESLKKVSLNKRQQSELLGRLFIDEEIITSSQISCVKKEMKKPSYDYNCSDDNAWAFYNHVTHSLKSSPPRDWMQDSQNFHDFMMTQLVASNAVPSNNDFDWKKVSVNNNASEIDVSNMTVEYDTIEVDENISNSVLIHEAYITG